jgi:hypothetical protein
MLQILGFWSLEKFAVPKPQTVRKESHESCTSTSTQKCCINCLNYDNSIRNSNKKILDTKHDALYRDCPSLKHMKNLIESKVKKI